MFGPRHTLKSVLKELEVGLRDGTIVPNREEVERKPQVEHHNGIAERQSDEKTRPVEPSLED